MILEPQKPDSNDIKILKHHIEMLNRLKKWLLDSLIVVFVSLGLLLLFHHNFILEILFGTVAATFGIITIIVGYGIYRGQSRLDSMANKIETP